MMRYRDIAIMFRTTSGPKASCCPKLSWRTTQLCMYAGKLVLIQIFSMWTLLYYTTEMPITCQKISRKLSLMFSQSISKIKVSIWKNKALCCDKYIVDYSSITSCNCGRDVSHNARGSPLHFRYLDLIKTTHTT